MQRNPASQRQIEASDPANSTWVSANAGSGKTRVLTDRVARLLLARVSPQNILCLTYTKAAASEMQNRLFNRLGSWAMMSDEKLRNDLRELGVEDDISAPRLRTARTLFARAIETPGGLKIQTIHSFCAGLLRRFPLEAGISPQFTEMEDRASALLRAEVVDQIAIGPDQAVVDLLARHFTDADFDKLLQEIAAKRGLFEVLPDEGELRRLFELAAGLTPAVLLQSVLPEGTSDLIGRLRDLCLTGSANDLKAAERLAEYNHDDTPDWADLVILEDVFLTGEKAKSPFSAKLGTFPTKPTQQRDLDLMAQVEPLMEAVEAARQDRIKLMALDRTRALYAFAEVFIRAYEGRKLHRGMLDFDDLIRKARALLTDPLVAQWVLFRLDGGIDHILVDEAQDTSPDQWAVIERLAQEFATGEGAQPDRKRTIFVVGDKKQSIYSFQGADPEGFDRMRNHFDAKLKQAGDRIFPLQLEYSFRSAEAILRVVDLTFFGPTITGVDTHFPHRAFKENMPGRVDLWPPIAVIKDDDEGRIWTDPLDQASAQHHDVRLAERIATAVREMVDSGTIPVEVGKTGVFERRKITEGDILVLVPRRSGVFPEIIRACKAKDLKVAGADRLRVGAELAVRDIAALLRFLALPEDDFSLAAALKSPLFGWTEQMLYHLAQSRPEKTYLWSALRSADHPETLAILNDLRDHADFLRPYDLINRILTRHSGRKALLARLGPEAEDGIDALLSQALAYERNAVPGLTGFLEWIQTDDLEVKRQTEARGDRIRVMTVHGAKGLESPIVILPDTTKRDIKINAAIYDINGYPVWAMPKDRMPPVMLAQRDEMIAAQIRERQRLLYVAMTRAENWLIVCAAGDVGEGNDSWYNMVANGMQQAGAVRHDFAGEPGLRVEGLDWTGLPEKVVVAAPKTAADRPDFHQITVLPAKLDTVSPSNLGGAKVLADDTADPDPDVALARGGLVHRLLEHLPQTPPDQRAALANAIVAGQPEIIADAASLIADVLALIDAVPLAPVFAPSALAEVELTAVIPAFPDRRFHGAIDRLLIGEKQITAIDFKTNRLVPKTPEHVPEGILRQMGAYHAMLTAVYPDRQINIAILWTATAQLMPLSHDMLMDALSRATIP